jgi:hypothetical protein
MNSKILVTMRDEDTDKVAQRARTKAILNEIKDCSRQNWVDLFKSFDETVLGYISSYDRLRQLGSGARALSAEALACVARFAISKGWAGELCEFAALYVPPSKDEIAELLRKRRHREYLDQDPIERIIRGPMKMALAEQRRAVANLTQALSEMSPAGYSHAATLYMVYAWLMQNPPNNQRGKRQRPIVLARSEHQKSHFNEMFFPDDLPVNLLLAEHNEPCPYTISCKVTPIWESFNSVIADVAGRQPDHVASDGYVDGAGSGIAEAE